VRLTREASTENIHRSTPGSSVEGLDVIPDWSVIEVAVFDPGLDDLLAVLVPFDVADGTGGESRQSEAETEPTVPGEQRHFGGMYIHVTFLSPHQLRVDRIQICRPDQEVLHTGAILEGFTPLILSGEPP